MAHNIFISWSGERGKAAAEAFRSWIPTVIQRAKPWMSETDIDKGSRGLDEIAKVLDGAKIGIACVTPESTNAAWLLFEAGALTKALNDKTRLCTVLLAGLRPEDLSGPLALFQATRVDKNDIWKLVKSINLAIGEEPVSETNLAAVFDALWPHLENQLRRAEGLSAEVATRRDVPDMIAEILDLQRAAARRSAEADAYKEVMDDLLPVFNLIRAQIKAAAGIPSAEAFGRPGIRFGGSASPEFLPGGATSK